MVARIIPMLFGRTSLVKTWEDIDFELDHVLEAATDAAHESSPVKSLLSYMRSKPFTPQPSGDANAIQPQSVLDMFSTLLSNHRDMMAEDIGSILLETVVGCIVKDEVASSTSPVATTPSTSNESQLATASSPSPSVSSALTTDQKKAMAKRRQEEAMAEMRDQMSKFKMMMDEVSTEDEVDQVETGALDMEGIANVEEVCATTATTPKKKKS
jgi:hypothetical protein